MARSVLMQILIDCENQLGWCPKIPRGGSLPKARANQHRIMTVAMNNRKVSEEDLRLAYNYCRNRRQPIVDPLQLFGYVDKAKSHTARPPRNVGLGKSLDVQQAEALAWEAMHDDEHSTRWRGRIIRSVAAGLADTLAEWHAAGRGTYAPLSEPGAA